MSPRDSSVSGAEISNMNHHSLMRESMEVSLLREEMEITHSRTQNEVPLPLCPPGKDGESSGPDHRAERQETFRVQESSGPSLGT